MPIEVIMPALGMAQETGLLVAWLKHEGDTVKKGEPIMEVETDKTTLEIEAQGSGTLMNVTAEAGDEVPVGDVIALILGEGEDVSQAIANKPKQAKFASDAPLPASKLTPSSNKSATPVAARIAATHDIDVSRVPSSGSRITRADVEAYLDNGGSNADVAQPIAEIALASPKARRLALERNIDLALIAGSGPDGAVIAADVLSYKEVTETRTAPSPVPVARGDVQTGRMWQRMAERLTESWQMIPHFYLKREVNAAKLIEWRSQLKQRSEIKVTYTDLLVQVVARALQKHPYVNGFWNGEGVVFNEMINVGLAVAVDEGLLVPVIHNTDQLGVLEIAQARAGIVSRTTENKLKPDDLQGGTFSISNLGMYGIDEFEAIVNPPQAAILAVGNIVEKVVPVNGVATIQPMLTLSLSCDHRAVDGARGAAFLRTLANYIQNPIEMMD